MKPLRIAAAALAMVAGLAGVANAQTDSRPAPPVAGPLIGVEPMVNSDDATLTYRDAAGAVVINNLGAKMINCDTPGAPSGGSTGTVPSPYHPCR